MKTKNIDVGERESDKKNWNRGEAMREREKKRKVRWLEIIGGEK